STVIHRDLIIELAAQYRLPAVYFESAFVAAGGFSAGCRLRRSHPQGREACRPAGAGPNQIRAGHQPEDRQSARIDRARQAARPRRRGDRVTRREFITLLGGAAVAWPLAARAQQAAKLPIIGFLGAATPSTTTPWIAAFVQRLREFGWVEGRNIVIEYRWAEGRTKRYAEIAAEFVRIKV